MNKNINKKEFERSVCFTFFESYLEGADKMATVSGKDFAYDYLTGIIRYALYKEESEDPMVNAMVSALKNTIDANQNKRASGFSGENKEQTDAIIKYYKEHPDASEREVAEAVGCGKTKVNKVKNKYMRDSNPNHNTNFNHNSNFNNNPNSNLNINRETVGEGNGTSNETADAEEKNSVP